MEAAPATMARRVVNHMPPILAPTHGAPGSQPPSPPPFPLHASIYSLCPPSSQPSAQRRACPLPSCPLPCCLPFSLPLCDPSRLSSSLFWVKLTVTWTVCLPDYTLHWLASPVLCNSWSNYIGPLFSSTPPPHPLQGAKTFRGCRGQGLHLGTCQWNGQSMGR